MSHEEDINTAAASIEQQDKAQLYNQDLEAQSSAIKPTPFGRFNVNSFEGYTTQYEDYEHSNEKMMYPFTGNLNLGYQPAPSRKFANPVPAGISSLGISLFTLSLILLRTRHVTTASIVIGPFFFLSCLVQMITGIWCIALENTYASTILLCYGGFFGSYAAVLTGGFGVVESYSTVSEFDSALGYYLSAWTIFAIFTWLVTFKSTIPIVALTTCVWLFFLLLTIATFNGSEGCAKASGVFGFISAIACFYVAYVGLAAKSNSYGFMVFPSTYLPHSTTPQNKKFWNVRV